MTDRPDNLDGKTRKIKVACGNLYVTTNLRDNKIWEIFIKGKGCQSNQDALCRMVSLCLQAGLLDKVITQLKKVTLCNSCSRVKGEMPMIERKNFPHSCPDAIARVLLERIEELRGKEEIK